MTSVISFFKLDGAEGSVSRGRTAQSRSKASDFSGAGRGPKASAAAGPRAGGKSRLSASGGGFDLNLANDGDDLDGDFKRSA